MGERDFGHIGFYL
jgi:hypothetical protein